MIVDLSRIRLDGGTQSRAEIDQATVESYAEAMRDGATFPPVVLFFDGQHYWLADGFQRHAANALVGSAAIVADVRQGTRRDAVLYSVGANATHGKPRTNADKRRAVTLLLSDEEWSKRADAWIAEKCGVSQPFVGRVRAEVQPITVIGSAPALREGRDGKTRALPTPKDEPRPPRPVAPVVAAPAIDGTHEGVDTQEPVTTGAAEQPVAHRDIKPQKQADAPRVRAMVEQHTREFLGWLSALPSHEKHFVKSAVENA